MAEPLDPTDLVTLEELALSTMWEIAALVEVLERKGILTKQDVLDMIQELRQREPNGYPATAAGLMRLPQTWLQTKADA